MGAVRRVQDMKGMWEVDAATDLPSIDSKLHGTMAYIKNDQTWVIYNAYTDAWYILVTQDQVDTTGVVPISPA